MTASMPTPGRAFFGTTLAATSAIAGPNRRVAPSAIVVQEGSPNASSNRRMPSASAPRKP